MVWSCFVGEQLASSIVLKLLWVKSVELSHESRCGNARSMQHDSSSYSAGQQYNVVMTTIQQEETKHL